MQPVPALSVTLPLASLPAGALHIFAYLVCIVWALFTLVAVYHWLRYSHAGHVAIPSIIVHVGISAILIASAFFALAS